MAKSTISVIIPAYYATEGHWEMTWACINSLKRYSDPAPTEIILINDGSPYELTDHPDKDIIYIDRPENGGFPAAVNDGWAKSTGDIIITSNNDIVFTPGWMKAILKPLEMGYDISSIRTTDNTSYDTEDEITDGDKFGSLWAMRRDVYDVLGGFDLRFERGYFEDTDYRRRAIDAGFKMAKNHAHLVEHTGRATFDAVDPTRDLYAKNIRVYAEKWGTVD